MTSLLAARGAPTLIILTGLSSIMVGIAWLSPSLLPDLIASLLALGGILLAYRYLGTAWVGWVLVTGLSMEMALTDLIGPEAFQSTIAADKATEIGLVALTILRLGVGIRPLQSRLGLPRDGGHGRRRGHSSGSDDDGDGPFPGRRRHAVSAVLLRETRRLGSDGAPRGHLRTLWSRLYWAVCSTYSGCGRCSFTAAAFASPGSVIRRSWPTCACRRSTPD